MDQKRQLQSLLAVVQCVFFFQMLFGIYILPAHMTQSDSAIFPQIMDTRVRTTVENYHHSNVDLAKSLLVYSALLGFVLSLVGGAFVIKRVNE